MLLPTGAGLSHDHLHPNTFGFLTRTESHAALSGDLLPGWAMWGLIVASPFASCIPDGVSLPGQPGPSSLPSPLQQPLTLVYTLLSLWCLTSPQVKY